MKKMTLFVLVFLLGGMPVVLSAADATARHAGHDDGTIGPNGVKQRIALRISKTDVGKDAASIVLDLGAGKYESTKPAAFTDQTRPVLILSIGSMSPVTAQADAKGKVTGAFKAKLINKGAGIKIDFKKSTLNALLAELTGKTEDMPALLTIKLEDNHAPAAASASADSRHTHVLFEKTFEVEVSENEKLLIGKH